MGSWVLVRLPSSLRAGLESMYSVGVFRAASITRYINFVEVTFTFLCLPEDALGRLDSRFSLTICLLMTRTACLVLRASFSCELSEL